MNPSVSFREKSFAVFGGMGVHVTHFFLQCLFEKISRDFGVYHNADFPRYLLLSQNSVGINLNDSYKETPEWKSIAEFIKNAKTQNSLFFISPCNSFHFLEPLIKKEFGIPFLSIIKIVTEAVFASESKKVLVLQAPVCQREGLYEKSLLSQDREIIFPNEEENKHFLQIIRSVKKAQFLESEVQIFSDLLEKFSRKKFDGVIFGCTEFSLFYDFILKKHPIHAQKISEKMHIFNSVELLVDKTISKLTA